MWSSIRRLAVTGAAVSFALSAWAQDLDKMSGDELLALAKKEGSVTVFSLSSRIARVEKAFEEAFPGIDLIGVDLSSAKQIARIEAEQQAGVHAVDVVYMADTPVAYEKLFKAGRVTTYVPPRLAEELDAGFKDPMLWR